MMKVKRKLVLNISFIQILRQMYNRVKNACVKHELKSCIVIKIVIKTLRTLFQFPSTRNLRHRSELSKTVHQKALADSAAFPWSKRRRIPDYTLSLQQQEQHVRLTKITARRKLHYQPRTANDFKLVSNDFKLVTYFRFCRLQKNYLIDHPHI